MTGRPIAGDAGWHRPVRGRTFRCMNPIVRSRLAPLVLFALAALPCAARAQAPAAVRDGAHPTAAREHEEVRAAMHAFVRALNTLDVAAMDSAFVDDVVAFVPSARPGLVVGRAEVMRILGAWAARARAAGPRTDIVPERMQVGTTGDLAFVAFEVRARVPRPVTRRRSFVFRRVAGRWRIAHMHASDVADAPPPAER